MNEDNDPLYLVPEEYYYSVSRDVSEKELGRKSVALWEIPAYLFLLAMMFASTIAITK